jgi:hypothetical protein
MYRTVKVGEHGGRAASSNVARDFQRLLLATRSLRLAFLAPLVFADRLKHR